MEKLQRTAKTVGKPQRPLKVRRRITWESLSAPQREIDVRCEKASAPPFSMRQLPSVCKTGKEILIYRKYVRNSGQSDSDLLADHTHAKIVIISAMDTDPLGRQYDAVVQLAGCNAEQLPCCRDINFGHPPLPNCEGLVHLINKVVQSNWVVMQSDEAV